MVISELLVSNSVDDVLSLYKRTRFNIFKSVTTSGFQNVVYQNMGRFQRSMTERYTDLKTFPMRILFLNL